MRKFDGSVQQVSLQRPVRVVQSPVDARLESGSGGERLGVIKLSSFNARAQVGEGLAPVSRRGRDTVGWFGHSAQQVGTTAWLQPARHVRSLASPRNCCQTSAPLSCPACSSLPQRDTLAAVQRLQAAGADRLVLDLRDNRGGLVTEGVEVRPRNGAREAPWLLSFVLCSDAGVRSCRHSSQLGMASQGRPAMPANSCSLPPALLSRQVARLFLDSGALVVRTEGRVVASSAPITAPGPAATAGGMCTWRLLVSAC